MDVTYDPDDQFFVAFRAGYLNCLGRVTGRPEASFDIAEEFVWDLYVAWLLGSSDA